MTAVPTTLTDTAPGSAAALLVADGLVARAAAVLGRPFTIVGTVQHGDKRGRELGFPTANIALDGPVVPAFGVYACRADGRPAAASIGVRPTFLTHGEPLLEVHVLDFAGDLYGRHLRVEFLARLRGEVPYVSAQALIDQMHKDVELTRAIAASYETEGR